MIIFYKEAKEALDSMKVFLEKIKRKLEEESTLEDADMAKYLQDKKIWVEEKIQDWVQFINQ